MKIQVENNRFHNDITVQEFYTLVPETLEEKNILDKIATKMTRNSHHKAIGMWLCHDRKKAKFGKQEIDCPKFVVLPSDYFGAGRWPGYCREELVR